MRQEQEMNIYTRRKSFLSDIIPDITCLILYLSDLATTRDAP